MLRSWVESANDPSTPFPIQNLPFGTFRRRNSEEPWRGGIAIGDQILDLSALHRADVLEESAATAARACSSGTLNEFIALGPRYWRALRQGVSQVLREGAPNDSGSDNLLIPQSAAEMKVPVEVGDYTDFFASLHHARRTSRIVRGQEDVSQNYRWLPVGYHGRASTIIVSDTKVSRPRGITGALGATLPSFGPSSRIDFELEMAAFIGASNPIGQSIPITKASDYIFGLCLMNDWSARDIQAFEAFPLGPFLGKSFATTVSPWIITMDALEPFRAPLESRSPEDPPLLPHLDVSLLSSPAGFRINLEATLTTERMRRDGHDPFPLTRSNFEHLYWSLDQIVAHHTSNGCSLRVGDMIGTGTISGPSNDSAACLLEITEGGKIPIQLPTGESRIYLEDGDEISITGNCDREGFRSIGFGVCRGTISQAPAYESVQS